MEFREDLGIVKRQDNRSRAVGHGLFIAVVLAFPNGLSGIWADHIQPRIDRLLSSRKSKSAAGMIADGAPAE